MSRSTPVGPRAPKEEFMRALNLTAGDQRSESCYRAMRDEAISIYGKLNSDRSSLVDERRNDPSTTPPFFWHHIRPDRRKQAIIDTWQQAKPGSVQRTLFDRGATTGEHAPNWVTLWLLYSVFRSRDIRNNRNRRGEGGNVGNGQNTGNGDMRIFDPARNTYVAR